MKAVKQKHYGLAVTALAFAAAVMCGLFVCGLAYFGQSHAKSKGQIENYYAQSLSAAALSLDEVELNMSKLLVSADNLQSAILLSDTRHHALCAILHINHLPVSDDDKKAGKDFLNSLADWCYANFKKMADYDADVVFAVSPLPKPQSLFDNQAKSFYLQALSLNKKFKSAVDTSGRDKPLTGKVINLDLNEFADSSVKTTQEKGFKALDGLKPFTAQQAVAKAEQCFAFLGLRSVEIFDEDTVAYKMRGKTNDGNLVLSVSKNGGAVLHAASDYAYAIKGESPVGHGKEFAKDRAQRYAFEIGYDKVFAIAFSAQKNIATVDLAPKQNDVICYTDLIKIKIDLTSGKFLQLDAKEYCKNYCPRNLVPSVSPDEAQRAVSPNLSIGSCSLALIPSDSNQVLCYQFAGEYNGTKYLVYVDAHSGRQTQIAPID